MRTAEIARKTASLDVRLQLSLGRLRVLAGNRHRHRLLDHMLELFARHGRLILRCAARATPGVDGHTAWWIGGDLLAGALAEAIGDKAGIRRYGDVTLP
jgi:imidazoleglycerol-phosphate dehydratase